MTSYFGRALSRVVNGFSSANQWVGLGRSIIALAQASVVFLTTVDYLIVPVGPAKDLDCSNWVRAGTAFCVAEDDRQLVAWGLGVGLLVVASGILPRWTAPLHFAITYSISTGVTLPDGGESAALVATFFIMFVMANDKRRWHWSTAEASDSGFLHGVSSVGHFALRCQVAYIYLNSSLAKLSVDAWQEGTAVYYVTRMDSFGAAGLGGSIFRWLTSWPLSSLALTWGTIAAEFAIALLILRRGRLPAIAFAVSAALHLGIVVSLGIVSFGFVMIGMVMVAASVSLAGLPIARSARRSDIASRSNPTAQPTPG